LEMSFGSSCAQETVLYLGLINILPNLKVLC